MWAKLEQVTKKIAHDRKPQYLSDIDEQFENKYLSHQKINKTTANFC